MEVFVRITTLNKQINISANENDLIVNGNRVSFNAEEFMGRVQSITSTWKNFNINNSVLDGEECLIKIINNGKSELFVVKNRYPRNYSRFLDLLGEVFGDGQ